MPGTLFLVATPIGHLEDITLRALRVLREAAIVAAEDTRRTGRLLAHYGIQTPMLSFHQHNQRGRVPQLVERLRAGDSIALVTDAGTPGVSDPGVELVAACVAADIPIDPVPGASAPLAAVVASGFPVLPLTIFGFPPHKGADRNHWWSVIAETPHTLTMFEAPHRLRKTLSEAQGYLGNRQIVVARELSKVHQEFVRGTAADVLAVLTHPRGEFTFVIGPSQQVQVESAAMTDEEIAREMGNMTNLAGESRGQLVAAVARKLGQPRRAIYAALERVKNSPE